MSTSLIARTVFSGIQADAQGHNAKITWRCQCGDCLWLEQTFQSNKRPISQSIVLGLNNTVLRVTIGPRVFPTHTRSPLFLTMEKLTLSSSFLSSARRFRHTINRFRGTVSLKKKKIQSRTKKTATKGSGQPSFPGAFASNFHK